ncbi:MAG: hypothetical protein UV61_C0010G0006 [Candidatus Gottesmanbacteria bacterium GW2011_GWB1_43_11]|uniref:Uncharacterized protein n=1 Tax=Candidatus Gottesmanbacteria bacterium GW2011_GWB1_43_11 TaxID=1618446 RepID=A0A0G1CKV5_9BACT|nr:MAG: hypothetical protein UV04_C0012G0006 [Candidatus Gottesmanbacteria bacterium GW2011_GWA2_42_16]KKS53521.1 MAG: hypothetical protein UV17_C0035G0006 [Candidatus Gottesmanbacteria bacterium GW2011_GWA1_42_26]KKS81196.1 MAG: hypothetical protein UV55_C0018G0006 [Candidatus Gottesmanbacteria bacterium GW2011_GWC1_43_10]KKS86455.1 MAG: hypothetical protein UV61_C0010G0006 [Candidatus Gottesmanbacteria bacterium GW2011_GWB1_43_11]OGG10101.1 MAG: hypothetical protein A2699_03615 [Candidatus Go
MNITDLTQAVLAFFPWGFAKLAILVLIGIYIVFAAIMVRQEQLMAKVIEIPFSPILRLVALVHLLASVIVWLLALVLI